MRELNTTELTSVYGAGGKGRKSYSSCGRGGSSKSGSRKGKSGSKKNKSGSRKGKSGSRRGHGSS